jgi:hypothetical protein
MFGKRVELNKGRGLCPMFRLPSKSGWTWTVLFKKNIVKTLTRKNLNKKL